jgi:hypothetical protein
MPKGWLSFGLAVAEILERHNVSQGTAQVMLRKALAIGDIQSRRAPFEQKGSEAVLLGPWEPVRPEQWCEASIDLAHDLVDVYVPDFRDWLGKPKSAPKKRGRPPKVDWEGEVKQRAFAFLDYHGAPSGVDPEWGTQAALEKAIIDSGIEAAPSTVRKYAAGYLIEWKARKAEIARN